MENQLETSVKDLQKILKHSVAFLELLIPCAQLRFHSANIDCLFLKDLCNDRRLYWLDLTECTLSTLCSIPCLPNIEILNLSECRSLVDEVFGVILSLQPVRGLHKHCT